MFAASKTASVSGGYQISRSLRFNRADAAYLNRTPASTGSRTTFTISLWLKLGSFATGTDSVIWSSGDAASGNPIALLWKTFSTNYYFNITGTSTEFATTQLFRDPSAWYHIVLAVDTTQATDTNRIKLYVNGVQVTSFTTATYPAQNFTYDINTASYSAYLGTLAIGASRARYWDGYQTEVNFIDGSQLTPSSFGETNAQTGVWQPKAYSGSYGTNGFYLNFSDNSNTTAATLGADYSGNGNNWTPNNFSVTAGAGNDSLVDSPTSYGTDTGVGGSVRGNYCTLNPLRTNSAITLSNGNLDASTSIGGNRFCSSTFGLSSEKWYWESTVTNTQELLIGVESGSAATGGYLGNDANGWGYDNLDGKIYNNGVGVAYGNTFTTNDVIGVAIDMDAKKIWFSKNGVFQNSGSPTGGTNAAATNLPSTVFPAVSPVGNVSSCSNNFGQRPFAYTAPSGFKALCTQNLPTPTIGATSATTANKYFDAVTYSGSASSQTVVNSGGFQPDLVWAKSRSNALNNILVDSLRGGSLFLVSNSTAADATSSGLATFASNGITWVGGASGVNDTGITYVDWMWKANGSGSTNTAGTITSTVSANTTSGFSVVTYTATGSNATVGHGLGAVPSMIIVKSRTLAGGHWTVYHSALGNTKGMLMNTTDSAYTNSGYWNNTTPTSTVFSIGTDGSVNQNTQNQVAYCFAEVAGYSKFGSYTGNGSTDGPFVYCGFRPAFIMYKRSSASGNSWRITDSTRSTYNVNNAAFLYPDTTETENFNANDALDILSNGFKIRSLSDPSNASGSTYIFMAFASNPFKTSLAR